MSFDPLLYRRSNIDTYPDRMVKFATAQNDFFYLFEFSAKLDPVPTMLVQDHVNTVNGFMGQVTGFRKSLLKKSVIDSGAAGGVRRSSLRARESRTRDVHVLFRP